MVDVSVSEERMLSSYGGRKTKVINVAAMDSADVLKLSAEHGEVVDFDLKEVDNTGGWLPLSFSVGGTALNELTLKTAAKTAIEVQGTITYKAV